jgi:hypothetical protein
VRCLSVPLLLRRVLAVGPVAVLAAGAAHVAVLPAAGGVGPLARVIVTVDGGTGGAEGLVSRAGGTLGRRLPLVGGFAADVPVAALPSSPPSPSAARAPGTST